MQAMDEPKPNELRITSETTRRPHVDPRPPGGAGPRVELVLRLAMMECHTWLGIGGRTGRVRRPKRISRQIPLAMDDDDSSGCVSWADYMLGGVDYCRRGRIVWAVKDSLEDKEEFQGLSLAQWREAVPQGVERAIADAIADREGGGDTFKVIVDISVQFEFVYSEPDELLLACFGGPVGRSGNDGAGDGEAPSCSICFEEMSRESWGVTDLPGCTHSFHFWCIDAWFHEASTCPVCRRDQLRFLPPDYRDLHYKMTKDPGHESVAVV